MSGGRSLTQHRRRGLCSGAPAIERFQCAVTRAASALLSGNELNH